MTGHANEKLKVGHIHACGFMQNTVTSIIPIWYAISIKIY